MNMSNTVIIPTVGTGSRMGNYTKNLNKALLPYKEKPILAHIIDNFPKDTRFIIPVGYLANQIIDFCSIAYSDRNIEFVDVDDYTSSDSGTAYTLKQCKDLIDEPFWYVPCDTYFDELVMDHKHNCYYVKHVPKKDSPLYTMFQLSGDTITDITFKKHSPIDWFAFTGLMYINDWENFFTDLDNIESNEFIYIIGKGDKVSRLDSWLDFGSSEIYQTELSKTQKFDFTKKDEVTYICNQRVVKWWLDDSIAKKKYDKVISNPTVFPDNCSYSGNFIGYDYFPGKTLYEYNDSAKFNDLLIWLHKNVWKISNEDITKEAVEFYKTKTLARIGKLLEKYPKLDDITYVDGVKVEHYEYYLNNIDWDYLTTNNLVGFLHGDLQFDNIIIDDRGMFKIIDWRHEFAGLVTVGDIYYDLAKMAGGLIINYANIKNHNFDIEINANTVTLSIPNVNHITVYQQQLKKYIVDNGLDCKKVQQLIPIIFWNMSPLHTAPFDIFLWYLGIKLFAENEKIHKPQ